MTDIGKFLSDVQKMLKHERQNNNGNVNYNKIGSDLRKLFERSTSCPGELPGSIFEYWEKQYIFGSADFSNEPSSESIQKLGAFLGFLDNSNEDEDLITQEDWNELKQLVNYEAEDLPIDILTELMSILVSKGTYWFLKLAEND